MNRTTVSFDIFSASECARIGAHVKHLRPRWRQRSGGFATIGVATYLDVMAGGRDADRDYYGQLEEQNGLLQAEFGWVLERVRCEIENRFGVPAAFEPCVAHPGFHIFEKSGITLDQQDSQHFDLQYRFMRWPYPIAESEVVSFTLAIELPRLGGGLDSWDVTEADLARMAAMGRRPDMGQLGRTKPLVRHEYRVGAMLVQRRPIMHRIAPIAAAYPDDCRITFQGHTVTDGRRLLLYW
ncbi:hypothetical protein ACSBM8_02545 [Sphingomonas sp. ASY06-1R]|uniref:hypothetical protein n=1 Tax=Sphingomonas sp. ASY06-1R TaxID=3445771 RepID=UPI003FA321B8